MGFFGFSVIFLASPSLLISTTPYLSGFETLQMNILHPKLKPRKSFLEKMIRPENGPVVAVSDYVKLVAEQISPYIKCPFVALGTDGFGRSDTRENLRNFFEINKFYIILHALDKLYVSGYINNNKIAECIKKYNIDFNKPNPNKV